MKRFGNNLLILAFWGLMLIIPENSRATEDQNLPPPASIFNLEITPTAMYSLYTMYAEINFNVSDATINFLNLRRYQVEMREKLDTSTQQIAESKAQLRNIYTGLVEYAPYLAYLNGESYLDENAPKIWLAIYYENQPKFKASLQGSAVQMPDGKYYYHQLKVEF